MKHNVVVSKNDFNHRVRIPKLSWGKWSLALMIIGRGNIVIL